MNYSNHDPPTFSVDEARAYLLLCQNEKEVMELSEIIWWEEEKYDVQDYGNLRVAINLRYVHFRLWREFYIKRPESFITISDNPIQY